MVFAVFVFCILIFPAVSNAASLTDSDWSQGILDRTLNDNGQLKIDYNFGTGKDGSFSGNFESKAPAWKVIGPASVTTGTTSVTLSSAPSGLSAGDEVLLVNLQGTQSDYSNVGNYEFLEVSSISGTMVTFKWGTIKSYGNPSSQAIFLQRVPHYTTAIVSQMTTSAFNISLSKTGIIAFRANNVVLNGNISTNSLGYSGGSGYMQGESIAGTGTQTQAANLGGGGGGYWAIYKSYGLYGEGGGGGHATNGANGGGNWPSLAGTGGGTYSSSQQLSLGSGGGGNSRWDGTFTGGRGGGAAIIYTRSITGSGSITAEGGYVNSGGGSGGTVTVMVSPQSTIFPTSQIDVSGSSNGGTGYATTGTTDERFLDGSFKSKVFDGGFQEGANWTNISVSLSQQMPAGNQIKVYYHVCSSSDCYGQDATWTECGTFTSGSVLRCDIKPNTNVGRYFQYRLDLTRSSIDIYATPSVSSVKIEYKSADDIPPVVTVLGPSGWVNTDRTAAITCTDSGTGCDDQSYRLRTYVSSPPSSCPKDYTQYTEQPPLTISYQTWVCGAAKDRTGNPGYTPTPVNFFIDKAAPTTQINPNGISLTNQDVSFSLTCSDTGGSSCQTTYYRIIDDGQACGTAGFSSGTSGILTCAAGSVCRNRVCYYSTDNSGNAEAIKTSNAFLIDKQPPVTTDDSDDNWHGNDVIITLTCQDSLAGCAATNYCIYDEGGVPCNPATSGNTVTVSCSGTCRKIIRYYSRDALNNQESSHNSRTIKIDTTIPSCTIAPLSEYSKSASFRVSWSATSPPGSSPISNVTIEKNETGLWEFLSVSQQTSGYLDFTAQNGRTYYFRCFAANAKGPGGYSVAVRTTVDTQPPSQVSIEAQPIINRTTFSLGWSGSDSESGVANYTVMYKIDSGLYSVWNVFDSQKTSAIFGQDLPLVVLENNRIYTFKLTVTDHAGNSMESNEASVLVDTAKPICTIQDMPAYQSSSDFMLIWAGADGESGVKEYIVEQRTASVWAQFHRGPETSKDIINANDGTYRFRCRAIDNANNMGDLSAEKSTTVDMNPPDAQINFSSSVYVNDSLSINARITDAIRVSNVTLYYENSVVPGTATQNPNYSVWDVSWTLSGLVTTGMKNFTISVQDVNGNSRNYSGQFLVAYCTPGDVVLGCKCGTGTKTCRTDGTWSDCTGATKQPIPEVCDGDDNDCNLIVDDVNGRNSILSTQCQCYGSSLLSAQSETCDGIDNDCDGQIDENGNCCNSGDIQSCGADVGVCRNKKKTCTGGTWGPCAWEQGPTSEICGNGLDDNCNGESDENCASCTDRDGDGYGDTASNQCTYSGQDCDDSDPNVNPGAPEVCDGIDNNCDGQTDEGLGDCGACSNGIQDANEEGTDCGGDCPACFVWGWLWLTAGGVVILLILAFVWLHFRRQGRELSWDELKKKWTPSE